MIYGTGGVAYGGGSSHFNVYDNATDAFWSGSPSSTRVGWTIGAGVEYAFTNNMDDQRANISTSTSAAATSDHRQLRRRAAFPNIYATAKINYNASIFRAGVNYKF